ncbi:MAG: hypothetical protein HDS77_04740 [Bacteroidales bacterium]|nr:hypothetical protein [Bacteroidales bacterium]
MKKVLLAAAILMGGVSAVVPALTVTASAQTCDPNSPCLYTGSAICPGVGSKQIVVKFDKNGQPVAEVGNQGTFYVFKSETDEDKANGSHYVNVNGSKYYFSM